MSAKADKALAAGFGKRRPAEVVQAEVADSILGEMVPPSAIDIPIEALYVSQFQRREPATADELNTLAESLQAENLISPIVIRPIASPTEHLLCKSFFSGTPSAPTPGRTYELITGHNRVQAALFLGWAVIPAIIRHFTDAQAARALAADNAVKRDLTDYDRYLTILVLEDTGACKTGREIASTLGVSTAQISNLRAFGKLPAEALAVVDQNRKAFGYRMVYDIVGDEVLMAQPDLITEAFDALVTGKIKQQNQVIGWMRQQMARAEPKTKDPRRSYEFSGHGQQVKILVTAKQATINATGLNCDKLSALIEANLGALLS